MVDKTYKFSDTPVLLQRGKDAYGSKENCGTECPTCFGGKRVGLLNCKTCNGTGSVEKEK